MFGRLLFRFLSASVGRISVLSFYPFSFKKQFFETEQEDTKTQRKSWLSDFVAIL
jgi:hypothetical protein